MILSAFRISPFQPKVEEARNYEGFGRFEQLLRRLSQDKEKSFIGTTIKVSEEHIEFLAVLESDFEAINGVREDETGHSDFTYKALSNVWEQVTIILKGGK